jgi:hypothetical protein
MFYRRVTDLWWYLWLIFLSRVTNHLARKYQIESLFLPVLARTRPGHRDSVDLTRPPPCPAPQPTCLAPQRRFEPSCPASKCPRPQPDSPPAQGIRAHRTAPASWPRTLRRIVTMLGATLILYIVNVPSFIFDQSSILTQEFEVLTAPIDMLVIRE